MGKDFYCPVCGAFQEHVNLEETDNTFICNKCIRTNKVSILTLPRVSMKYMDKHLNYFVAGVPNLNIKFFKSKGVCQGKGG